MLIIPFPRKSRKWSINNLWIIKDTHELNYKDKLNTL